MRTKKFDGSELRLVLIGMITDTAVCARVSTTWAPEGLFDAHWSNIIGGWCIKHFRKHGEAPKSVIRQIFEMWANDTSVDEKTVSAVEKFLIALSDQANSEEPPEHILDVAGRYFNKVRLSKEIEEAKLEIERGNVDEASERISSYKKVNLGRRSTAEPAKDISLWTSLSDRSRVRTLINYHGDLGEFIGDAFVRGALYSFMAPDKTGKTTWLLDLAYRAARARNRVAYFDLGDSNIEEVMMRLNVRTNCLPEFQGKCKIPCGYDDQNNVFEFKEKDLEAADSILGFHKFRALCKTEDAFKISCHESSSINVAGIDGILEEWERGEGWRADVVVMDYADILAPERGFSKDSLDIIDETWKAMRRLTQKRHVLGITATQSSANAYSKSDTGLLSKADFSGRKTKLAHVNGMIGINVNPKEKDDCCARVNWIVRRKGKSNERAYVKVAGCYDIGDPAIESKR